jgi:hypothetical protein
MSARCESARLGIDLLEVFADHLGLGDHIAGRQLQHRDAAERRGLAPGQGGKGRRPLERDVLDALGVDLHPHLGGIGAEVAGIELHGVGPLAVAQA